MPNRVRDRDAIYYMDKAPTFDFVGDESRIIITSGDSVFEFRSTKAISDEGSRNYSVSRAADALRNDNVVPLCELCVRHNLPRMGGS